jgi:hypothetical protein
MINKPDILAEITLFSTSEGGRQSPTSPDFFGCHVLINDQYHDVRFDMSFHGSLSPGESAVVPAKFLDSVGVLPKLSVGSTFLLWDGRKIGKAKVNQIYEDT